MNRIAFTLAEVLITLGIIGVVAAMTLPALVNNNRNKELENGLKVAYSAILQGLGRMNAERGNTVTAKDYTNLSTHGAFYEDFKLYFSKIYDCGKSAPDTSICMSRGSNSSGNHDFNNDLTYKTYNGNTLFTNPFDDGQFVLSNGMLILIENPQSNNLDNNIFISVDINGKKKKPNRLGQDLFTFQLMNNGKLLPMGIEGTVYPEDEFCSASSTSNLNGIGCTNKALIDSNYFKNLPK